MGRIFISYRREDSAGWTGRLSEHLRERFGPESIFMDIDTIQPGTDFTEVLQTAVSSCDVLLAMIGPEWATATDKSGKPRLEDPADWVRTEIAAALKRKIRVIPVLVGGASVPTIDQLPDDLDALAQRQAHELTDKRWSYDVEQLVKTLPAARQRPPTQLEAAPTASNTGQFKWAVIGALVVALAISAWVALKPEAPSTPPRDNVEHAASQKNPATTPAQNPSAKPELAKPKPTAASQIIHLRAGQEARFKANYPANYKVLTLQMDRSRPDTFSLSLTVRVTSASHWVQFGSQNFCLLVDDVPQVPTNDPPLEHVYEHSAKEGTFEFTVPITAQRLVLQLLQDKELAEFPLDITDTIPPPAPIAPSTPIAQLARTAKFPIALRAGQEARFKEGGSAIYKMLALQVDRSRPDTLSLSVTVRVTSGAHWVQFGSQSFRLLIDDVPRVPTNDPPLEHVYEHSAKEGTTESTFPITTQRLVLQLRHGNEVAEFPVDITETVPPPASVATSAPIAQLGKTAKFPIALHAGQEAQFKENYPAIYKMLALQVDRSRPDTLSLSVTVRVTSGAHWVQFGNQSFRLLVDAVPRAPASDSPLMHVDAHSAKESTIEFTFPTTTQRLVLQLLHGSEVAEFPLDLSPIS